MKSEVLEKSKMFQVFNDIALHNEIVVFGSSFASKFPFYELSQKYNLNHAIYNRSIEGLTLSEAEGILTESVLAVRPSKILMILGELDEADGNSLACYERILCRTKDILPQTEIYVLSVPGVGKEYNEQLKDICEMLQVKYVNVDFRQSYEIIFKRMLYFFRSSAISFCDAFCVL